MRQIYIQAKSFPKSKNNVCNHTNCETVYTYGKYHLYKCLDCGIVFSGQFKSIDPNSVYINYYQNETPVRFRFGIELIVKVFRLLRAFRLYTINPLAKSILDIGSGRGFTLYYLKKYFGYKKTVGTQIERNAYLFSKNKLGLEVYDKDLLDLSLPPNTFDYVTIMHVLEHVKYPEKYIIKIKRLLKKNGMFVIEVPNFDSWTRRFCGGYWLGLDLKYHLYFFNKKSLSRLLQKHGFNILKTHTFSLEYSTFTSAESIVSWLTKTDSVFFNFIQNNKFSSRIISHLFLFIVFAPFAFIINLILYKSSYGEDLLIVSKKHY